MTTVTTVLVGFDGSPGAECAVDWAAHEADRQGADLRIITVKPFADLAFGRVGAGAPAPLDHSEHALRVAADGRLRAEKVLDANRVDAVGVWGEPAAVLVRESKSAALVVIGHPAAGRAKEYLTGSVAFAVSAHAACDVAVVPRSDTSDLVLPGPEKRVVVGVDGSRGGKRAARRAAEIASRSGAALEIVEAWQLPNLTGWTIPTTGVEIFPDEVAFHQKPARESLEATAAAVGRAFPDLALQTRLLEGRPVGELLDAAQDAGLLVVGTRGLGGFKRLVLGSVSRAVVHYARLPVLVVRP